MYTKLPTWANILKPLLGCAVEGQLRSLTKLFDLYPLTFLAKYFKYIHYFILQIRHVMSMILSALKNLATIIIQVIVPNIMSAFLAGLYLNHVPED